MMARLTTALDNEDDERALRMAQQQKQQHRNLDEEDATNNPKTKKKKLRPRLKPMSCKDDDDDIDNDNPSLSITCARDLGFGSFVVTMPLASSSSSSRYSLKKKDDNDETNQDDSAINNHNDDRNSYSQPSSPMNHEVDAMNYSELVKKNSTITSTTTSITASTTTVAKTLPDRQQQQQQSLRRQSRPTTKLQPKSTVFSSPDESVSGGGGGGGGGTIRTSFPPTPHTPNAYDDEDGYGVFGFGLVSAAKDENKLWTSATTTYTVNDSPASELEIGKGENNQNHEGDETFDATFDDSNNSLSSLPSWNASQVQGGGQRRQEGGGGGGERRRGRGRHNSRISSISLSQVLSADSYISDDSTTSSDHPQQSSPQEQNHHHQQLLQHQQQETRNSSGPSANDAFFNRHDLLRNGNSLSSSNTHNFSALSRKSSLHTQASSRSITLHLMSSDRGDDDGTCNEDSINSSDSSLAAPSDVDSSYFDPSRALHPQQLQLGHHQRYQTTSVPAYPHQSYNASVASNQLISQGSFVPLTATSSRNLIAHTHPSPSPDDDLVELILSISEEESGERKLFHPTSTGQKYNNINVNSEEGRMMNDTSASAQKQLRVESLTPSSIDDQVISNEIRSYFRRISSPGTDSVSPSSPPPSVSSPYSSGRQPPIRGRHVESIIKHCHSTNDDGQRLGGPVAVASGNSAAHTRDSPFLTNLQIINSQASYGSVIHNLHGGNCTSEEEVEEAQQVRYDQSGKSFSSACTPHSKPITSLSYSDQEGLACQNRRLLKPNLGDWKEGTTSSSEERTTNHKVYSSRWIMLMYMTMLNLLSGWTCFSIAPFSALVLDSLGSDPDYLVATFFAANFIASSFEPMILRRLGLRRAVLLGALLLMSGNMLKVNTLGSSNAVNFVGRRAYLSFILAGLSGPLYQNTAAIVITTWFPQTERRIATDVVSCGNQLGMFCSFIVGNFLVKTSSDVLPYFHLLSVISMVVFVGAAMQFSDCPPTPPSGMTTVIRGTDERPIFAVVKLAPPSNESNWFVNTPKDECDTLLPTDSQKVRNSRQLSYGSTDPSITRPSLPADRQVERSITGEQNLDVEELPTATPTTRVGGGPPREAMTVQHGLEFFLCDFTLNFQPKDYLPPTMVDGAEPILTQSSVLNIEICDDQLWRALRACYFRGGFLPFISAYATSKVVINSLSTFMCYFSPDVGTAGYTFQLTVLVSSVLCRNMTGELRFHYMIIGLVALSTLSLGLIGANLDSKVYSTLNLLAVALFVGPLQPLSTNLGVEFVSPLSENTVVVNQLLFSNLLSVICILIFKALRNASATGPEFAYSFLFLALFCLTIHLSAIWIASVWAKPATKHQKEFAKRRSEQQIKSPNQEVGNQTLRPQTRDLPWREKFPFLIPRSV